MRHWFRLVWISVIAAIVILSFGCNSNDGNGSESEDAAQVTWGVAKMIGTDSDGDARLPQVATDAFGNAIAIWYQDDGNISEMWANRYDGSDWGTPELIGHPTENIFYPKLVMNTDGTAAAAWVQRIETVHGQEYSLWVNRFDGIQWGTPETVVDGSRNSIEPTLAINDSGQILITWGGYFSNDDYGVLSRFFNGTNWGEIELVENNQVDPKVNQILIKDDTFLAVYLDNYKKILMRSFDGGSWGEAETLVLYDDQDISNIGDVTISQSNNGKYCVVWTMHYPYQTYAKIFNGASWGADQLIGNSEGNGMSAPKCIIDDAGRAVAAWLHFQTQDQGGGFNLWVNHFNGTTWDTEQLLVDDMTILTINAQLIYTTVGSALAVWTQVDGDVGNIKSAFFDGNSWSNSAFVEKENIYRARMQEITRDANGTVIAVWEQFDGNFYNIWTNRLEN